MKKTMNHLQIKWKTVTVILFIIIIIIIICNYYYQGV